MPALGLGLGLPFGRFSSSFVGALDAYASTIAECWCPGKRLLSSWSGPAGILRESGGATEQSIDYLANGYLDTNAANSFISTGVGSWRTIHGQKGLSNLTQSTAASQPLYVGAHGGFNNRACLHLDTTLKGMDSSLDILRPYSILVIEQDDGSGMSLRTIGAYTGTPPSTFFENCLITANRSGPLSCFRSGTVSDVVSTAACVEVLTSPVSGNHTFYRDASDITTGTVAAGDWRKLTVGQAAGNTEGAVTKVFAVIVFNKSLSAQDISDIQNILTPGTL